MALKPDTANYTVDLKTTADEEKLIRQWLNFGWDYRVEITRNKNILRNKQAYINRVEYELRLIVDKGFTSYFLVTSDIVRWAKDHEIMVGPGRGSAAASLVCYLLRITEVDPIIFDRLMFERFIDPTRSELPDVDLDFDDERRHEVFEYAERKYGTDKVGKMANFMRYKGKNSIDDVARVYHIPKWEAEAVKKLIIERGGGDSRESNSLEDTFATFPKAREVLDRYPNMANSVRLEGNYRGMGVHAAGMVISNTPITDSCATYTKTTAGVETTVVAFDKKDSKYLGFLKLDILGLSTMNVIGTAAKLCGMSVEDVYRIPLTDKKTMAAFKKGDVVGIFQFEGRATRLVCRDVQPDTFQELVDINSLSRPGPLFSGTTAQYVDIKHDRADPISLHPVVDAETTHTHGQIIFQEQILRIIKEIGGFPMTRVHEIRQIISAKLGEAQFGSFYEKFEAGAKELHGIEPELALKIWRFMVTSATYTFCVAGNTLLERSGGGRHDPRTHISVKELYDAQESRTSDGKLTPIAQKMKYQGLQYLGMHNDGRIRQVKLMKIGRPVAYHCSEITTDSGKTITVSDDHILLTPNGYKHLMELQPGDQVVIACTKEERVQEKLLLEREIVMQRRGYESQQYKAWEGESQSDTTGFKNPAFVDGRYALLQESKKHEWKSADGKCRHCGVKFCETDNYGSPGKDDDISHKYECAHIRTLDMCDGNWLEYNASDNIMLLCNSCHRKYDYRIQGTRKKRWSAGRPTKIEIITSIERAGIQDVYDIVIDDTCHNYVGNGFINHNVTAHSTGYSIISWWGQWFKQHKPAAFYAARLRKEHDDYKRTKLIKDAQRHGIKVVPPDPLFSEENWTPEHGNTVRAGFIQIPGVGPKTAQAIMDFMESTVWETAPTWDDLIKVKGIGPKTIEKIKAFVNDPDPFGVNRIRRILTSIREELSSGIWDIPEPTHTSDELAEDGSFEVVWVGFPKSIEQKDVVEDIRARTDKPTEQILAELKDPDLIKLAVIKCIDDGDEDVHCRINRWDFPRLKDRIEDLRTDGKDVLIVRGKKRDGFGTNIIVRDMWALSLDD